MKTRKIYAIMGILAIFSIILSVTTCDNGTTSPSAHVHQWGEWAVTTAPTCTTEGEETRVCTIDTTHKETRSIAALGHDWGNWTPTTAPTYTTEGVETRACTHDATHIETRAISRIPFTSVAGFGTWLTSQPNNTAETAYTVMLNINDEDDLSALKTALNNASDKFIYLDLSGSTITEIPSYTFNTGDPLYTGCYTLTGITIPNSVESIGNAAFADCTNLISVTIPNSVKSIGIVAFGDCTNLTSISIPNSVESIGIGAFTGCTSLTSITIGNSITSISGMAFYYCTSLTSITIPNSVTSILHGAFSGCTNLTSVTFEGTIPSTEFYDGINPPFLGDLRDKFYATDPTNGTPGTYTTTAPVGASSVWVKQ